MTELLILIRSALKGKPVSGLEYEALCRWDLPIWKRTLKQAGEQAVLGLAYQAVKQLPEATSVPESIVFQLVGEAGFLEAQYRKMDAAAREMIRQLTRYGLHPLLMKGPEAARLYPCPELRGFGDIDLYVPPEEDPAEALRTMDFSVRQEADGSLHFEYDGIDVDVHTRYFDLSCPPEELPEPASPEATLLMLSAHALKHAAGTGIGLRQICDTAAAFRALDGQYSPEAYLGYCRKAGILGWSRLLGSFLENCLDVPDRLFPGHPVSPEPLLELIREGGNFGHHASSRRQALERSSFRRKTDTALRFMRRLPFSLRYAPRQALFYLRTLLKGNLSR